MVALIGQLHRIAFVACFKLASMHGKNSAYIYMVAMVALIGQLHRIPDYIAQIVLRHQNK